MNKRSRKRLIGGVIRAEKRPHHDAVIRYRRTWGVGEEIRVEEKK